jgi:glycosyltransferase involved in cell wall biosynthesis
MKSLEVMDSARVRANGGDAKSHEPAMSTDRLSTEALRAPESDPNVSIVVPVYRSEDCLVSLVEAIDQALTAARRSYEVILVNDCSPDGSWTVIESICQHRSTVVGVDLRRNFGQDNAILTGFRIARGKYVAVMDDDLQHHPRYLPALLEKIEQGADVVFADYRVKRQKLWKNVGSWFNGKVAGWVVAKPKDLYLSPYKIIRREVIDLICQYVGPDPYVDGLLLQVTSRMAQVPVEHCPRYAGRSTYTLWKSIRVWARLAFSFSVRPLRIVSWCGFIFTALAFLLAVAVILYRLLFPEQFLTIAVGWASLIVTFLFVGGAQMVFFGVLGEYAGRTYLAVNGKPQTSIREVISSTASERTDLPQALSLDSVGEAPCQRV